MPKLPEYALVRKKETAYIDNMELDYNRRQRTTEGSYVSLGDQIGELELNTSGIVVRRHELPRSVVIELPRRVFLIGMKEWYRR